MTNTAALIYLLALVRYLDSDGNFITLPLHSGFAMKLLRHDLSIDFQR